MVWVTIAVGVLPEQRSPSPMAVTSLMARNSYGLGRHLVVLTAITLITYLDRRSPYPGKRPPPQPARLGG